MSIKIALCGKLRSGKDTAADYLESKYGFSCYAFGTDLKRIAHELYGFEANRKPRELYQKFGQMCREIDPDVWVNKTLRKIEAHQSVRSLITDLRQPNEYERLKADGYVFIRIDAPLEARIKRAIEAGDDFSVHDLNHETERAIDGFKVDFDVDNDGTVGELEAKLDQIMAEVLRIG